MRLLFEVCLVLQEKPCSSPPDNARGAHDAETSSSISATLIGIGSIDGEFIVSWTPNPN